MRWIGACRRTRKSPTGSVRPGPAPGPAPGPSSIPGSRRTRSLCPIPNVSLFLHGPQRSADVQIVWRRTCRKTRISGADVVALAPPSSLEALPVPIHAARAWLESSGDGIVGDIEGQCDIDISDRRAAKQPQRVLRWRGPEDSGPDGSKPISAAEIRAGDTIVVPSTYGGSDSFGWNPNSDRPVEDVGELAALLARGKPVLRIHHTTIAAWQPPTDDGQPSLTDRVRDRLGALGGRRGRGRFLALTRSWMTILADPGIPQWVRLACEKLRDDRSRDVLEYPTIDGDRA